MRPARPDSTLAVSAPQGGRRRCAPQVTARRTARASRRSCPTRAARPGRPAPTWSRTWRSPTASCSSRACSTRSGMSASATTSTRTAFSWRATWRPASSPRPTSSNTISTATRSTRGGRSVYLERFIHGEVYRARPDVIAVVHSHSPSVIPFGIVKSVPFRPVFHMAAFIGEAAPIFEIRDVAGDATDLLITDRRLGAALAETLGPAPSPSCAGTGRRSSARA